jgi:hypothetical protein
VLENAPAAAISDPPTNCSRYGMTSKNEWLMFVAMIEFARKEGRIMTAIKIKVQRHEHAHKFSERMEITMWCLCLLAILYVGIHVLAWIAR